MASEYASVALGDVASVRSGYAFKSSDWTDSGVPVVKIANVKEGRLNMEGCSFVSPSVAASAADFALVAGDIVLAMTGYIGDVALVRESDVPVVLNQRVGLFSIQDRRRLDPRFLFYVLRTPTIRSEIEGQGYGSAQANVSPALIHRVKVPLPPLPAQRAIAQILGSLDDKIELNRRTNETLEAIARALFKSWFVDFDPVRAKAEGSDPGLPAHLAELFPDSFEDSELGEIPRGWSPTRLGEIAGLQIGGDWGADSPTSKQPVAVRCLRGVDLHSLRVTGTSAVPLRFISEDSLYKRSPTAHDVIVEGSGECGRSLSFGSELDTAFREPIVYSNFCKRIRAPSPAHAVFLERTLNGLVASGDMKTYVTGTAMPNLDLKGLLGGFLVALPPSPVLTAFAGYSDLARARRLAPENRLLAGVRDTLLPELISGEMRIVETPAT